jgi:DNA invertase Pin-like site-specific DNA recombinase
VVVCIDRLACSLNDLQDIAYELKMKSAALRKTEQPVDTGTAAGKAFLAGLVSGRERDTADLRELLGRVA